jgi:hypothetical protein
MAAPGGMLYILAEGTVGVYDGETLAYRASLAADPEFARLQPDTPGGGVLAPEKGHRAFRIAAREQGSVTR